MIVQDDEIKAVVVNNMSVHHSLRHKRLAVKLMEEMKRRSSQLGVQ
jgi:glycylpeptide N-tetradecanoyltransferase